MNKPKIVEKLWAVREISRIQFSKITYLNMSIIIRQDKIFIPAKTP